MLWGARMSCMDRKRLAGSTSDVHSYFSGLQDIFSLSVFQTFRQKIGPIMADNVYQLTITLTTGTDLDLALTALECSDLGGMTLETIRINVIR